MIKLCYDICFVFNGIAMKDCNYKGHPYDVIHLILFYFTLNEHMTIVFVTNVLSQNVNSNYY